MLYVKTYLQAAQKWLPIMTYSYRTVTKYNLSITETETISITLTYTFKALYMSGLN